MPISETMFLSGFTLFAAPFLRLSAMMLVAPIFSAPGLSVRVKVLLATLVAGLVAPSLPDPQLDSLFGLQGLMLAKTEIGIGLMMGYVLQLVCAAAVFAAQAQSMTMGLGFAMAMDPQNGVQVPVVAQMFVILTTLLFLAVDAHLFLIAAVVESYNIIPPGNIGVPLESFLRVVTLGALIFSGGILLALPILTALLLINIALGIVTRAAPQLNIFAVGFPVTIISGLVIMFVVMPTYVDVLGRLISQVMSEVTSLFT